MMTADFTRGLPDLRAGVYRHWKGHYYLVLGYAHDANADTLVACRLIGDDGEIEFKAEPLGERTVVVYVGLELDDANKGPRLAVRTAQDFFALVCNRQGHSWIACGCTDADPVPRFEYIGAAWYGWPRNDPAPSDHSPAPDSAAASPGDPTVEGRPQAWAPCGVVVPHEPHGPETTVRCPGVPARHKANTTNFYGAPA